MAAAALAVSGLCASGLGHVGAGTAGAQASPPAFFTWQAPGASLARAAALAALAGLPQLRSHLQNRMVFGWRR
jgi:hypothetical protein